jgi:hypothetical protein
VGAEKGSVNSTSFSARKTGIPKVVELEAVQLAIAMLWEFSVLA